MKKKLLSMMLALSMVLTLLPGTAFAGSVTFEYVDGKWTVSGESGNYTVDGTSITYTITLGASSIEIKADSDAEGKVDMEALPDDLTDAQKNTLRDVAVRSEDLGRFLRDHEDIADELIEAGRKALEDAGSAEDKNACVDLGLGIEITDTVFDKNNQATFLALEITAVYTVTVDGKKSESSVLTFGYPIELTVTVPDGLLANGANVSIEHSKDGSSYHPHTVTGIDRTNNTVTFTSTDGLSPFTISSTQPSDGTGGSGGGNTPSTPSTPSTGGGTPSTPSAPSNPSTPSTGGTSGGTTHTHYDRDNDHKCDDDGTTMTDHADEDADHICDTCGETITDHADEDADHICDTCGETITDHADEDADHICDTCGETITDHADEDGDHICDICGETITDHADEDGDHICDICGETMDGDIIIDDEDVPLAGKPFLFTDVTEDKWYYDYIKTVYEMGLMNGVGTTIFDPESPTTRGMVAQVLYNMEGKPSIDGYDVTIPDLKSTDWYYKAAVWAYATGVYKGYEDGSFHGDDEVTREQLMIVLYRYARQKGYDVSALDDLSAFMDKSSISGWALGGAQWAVGTGLVRGRSGNQIMPGANTLRAELATILVRFVDAYTDIV